MLKNWVKWVEVKSETIDRFKYQNGKLFVVYKGSEDIYVYNNVPEKKLKKLLQSSSIGQFLNKEIKPNHKLSTKLKSVVR